MSGQRSIAFAGLGRIDVHHHCFPGTVPELKSEFEDNSYNLNYSPFPSTPQEHIKYMDEVGIQTAVITPSIKSEWHNGYTAPKFLELCRRSFQAQLEYVFFNPLRFGCFAVLPLPHIQETITFIRETSSAPTPPDGFAVTTAMGQRYLGDPAFEPVWAEINKLRAVVFIHPADTVMPEYLNFGPFVQEFPFDTARAITSIIHSSVLVRQPDIRFLFSHNGGAFPYLADRIGRQHLDNVVTKKNEGLTMRDILATKNIYFDTSISSPMQYPIIKDLGIPSKRLLYATDYPYTKRDDNITYLDGYNAPKDSGLYNDAEMEGILRENSLELFPRLAKLYAALR
ncbi:2-amino-3-carboxymuconate-6-semialdehyde decarboxylase [Penicillium lagena]|uniref:2-amino-3-carboxymuconate-6-semialdehyde decarboxylase n=1 Tax=Penicillium lagena TaxID=94218 RepID=UPI00254045B9|nr:2-amino-3-carboxymuconate-6-semialdehyde decarboxylase [Penicillium lagena]KAJ5626399.1 2-amino-3-carboxymuconate-6-semialdehyde decarboxylase [Penicillium lagena]